MGAGNYLFGGLVLVGIVLIGNALRQPSEPEAAPIVDVAPDPVESRVTGTGVTGVAIPRAADRHFYADATVNGVPIRFLVDTGSSAVVLTQDDARRAGLGAGNYDAKAIGAGGEIKLMPVRLSRLTMGPLVAESVPAMVAEQGRIPVSLLGQSFLDRLDSVTIQGDTMTLR